MDVWNEKNHFFNIKLAKITGLYQMLDPETVKYRGRNVYHILMACVLVYMSFISMILMLSGLYYWTDNIPISMDYFCKTELCMYIIYKMWFIIHHSNDIWNCLSITWYDFTSFSNRNRHTGSLARSFGVVHDRVCDNVFHGDGQLLDHHLGVQ